MEHGADLHARDEEWQSTPLAWAAREGQTRTVEFLLRRGAKVSPADDPPWATARAWAERRGHAEIVRLLDEYEHSGVLPPRRLERGESLAGDLVDAYGPGEADALQGIAEYFQMERALARDRLPRDVRLARLRKAVRERLGDHASTGTTEAWLAIDDARSLIARAEGFERWDDLVKDVQG